MSHGAPPEQDQASSLARHSDGAAVKHRNRAIDELVKDFTTWDWLYLRTKMRTFVIDRDQIAGLEDLPMDILPMIAAHLTLSETMKCALVSKGWRDAWTDSVVTRCLLQQHFPGALQCFGESVPAEKLLIKLMNLYSKPVGKDWIETRIPWNIGVENEVQTGRKGLVTRGEMSESWPYELLYAAGKAAWPATRSVIVVDDFAAGTWRQISFLSSRMQGLSTDLMGFSGDILIVGRKAGEYDNVNTVALSRRLVVHHMALGAQKHISLPSNLIKCFTHEESAIFLTQGCGAYLYRWGGAVRQLETSVDETLGVPSSLQQEVSAALFHPSQSDTVFLISEFYAQQKDGSSDESARMPFIRRSACHIVVTKHHQGRQVRHQTMPLNFKETETRCYAANATGLYAICDGYLFQNVDGLVARVLTYNVLTEAFYEAPGWIITSWRGNCRLRIWNSRRVDHVIELTREAGVLKDLSCLEVTDSIPMVKVPGPALSASEVGWQEIWQQEECQPCILPANRPGFPRGLYVDDDFIVIVSHLCGYSVMSARNHKISLVELKNGVE